MFKNERRTLHDNAQLLVVEPVHLAAFAGYGLPPLDLLPLQQQVKDILVIPADTGVQLLHAYQLTPDGTATSGVATGASGTLTLL